MRSPTLVSLAALAALGVGAASAVLLSGCADDPVESACVVEPRQIAAANQPTAMATPLMLLPDARLDVVGDAFALLGTDGVHVRWAVLGRDGVVIGEEHAISIPEHRAGPWFAVAGINAPADHLVIAYVPADAPQAGQAGQADLLTFSVRIDNTEPTQPVSSGPIAVAGKVSMISGRAGMHAGITWATPGQSTVWARILGGDGLPLGADLDLGTVDDSGCLRFSSGRGDLTVGYVDLSGTPPDPVFVGTEISESGTSLVSFRLRLGKHSPGCVELTPGAQGQGYGLAWYSAGLGTYFGTHDPGLPGFPSARVLSDVRVDGPIPGLKGLGWLGKSYAVVFAWPRGAEVWPIDAGGRSQGTLPLLPSVAGHLGTVSAQAIGSTMYITYPDYPSATDRSAGARLLIKVSCP